MDKEGNEKFLSNLNLLIIDQVDELKKRYFNIDQFRFDQRAIINATLAKKDCFVIMPTGMHILSQPCTACVMIPVAEYERLQI